MTIASEIERLQGVKSDILGAIAEKKVDVPTGAMLADAPELIRSIKSGINVKIGQGVYPAVKIGKQLWLAKNLDEELGTLGVDEWYYGGRSTLGTKINDKTDAVFTLSKEHAVVSNFYDWNTGVVSESSNRGKTAKCVGNYIRVLCNASLSSPAPVDFNLSFRITYQDTDGIIKVASTGSYKVLSGETNVNVDFEIFSSLFTTSNGLSRLDILKSSLVGDLKATLSNIQVFCSPTSIARVSLLSSIITVPQALANEEAAKANNYGRLYTWNNLNENISKLGLTKWRWPTKADYDALVALDPTGKKLRSKDFNGTDDFGFNAVSSGYRSASTGDFTNEGTEHYEWSSTERTQSQSYPLYVNLTTSMVTTGNSKPVAFSLRLVMDLNEDGTIPDSNIVIEDVPATAAEPLAIAAEAEG